MDDIESKLSYHFVLHYIVVESVRDVLLSVFLIDLLLEDCAEASPPSSEALSRVKNVA